MSISLFMKSCINMLIDIYYLTTLYIICYKIFSFNLLISYVWLLACLFVSFLSLNVRMNDQRKTVYDHVKLFSKHANDMKFLLLTKYTHFLRSPHTHCFSTMFSTHSLQQYNVLYTLTTTQYNVLYTLITSLESSLYTHYIGTMFSTHSLHQYVLYTLT